MNSAANSSQQEEGEPRTGMAQKDVKSRRRSVMDIFHDSLHNAPSSDGHVNDGGSDYFPSNAVALYPISCEFDDTKPDPLDDVAPANSAEKQAEKPPKSAFRRKGSAAVANPWGLIFKNRENFVEIHLR